MVNIIRSGSARLAFLVPMIALAVGAVDIVAATPSGAAALSSGCTSVNSPIADASYQGASIGPSPYFVGEKITVTTSAPFDASATMMHLKVNGIDVTGSPIAVPGTLTYTFTANVTAAVSWWLNGGNATWTADCVQTGCLAPPGGMIAWYPFDENSGTSTANLRPPPASATLLPSSTNHPVFVPGKVANALKFDGIDDYAQAQYTPTSAPNVGTGDFSIDFWINTSQGSGQQTILDKRTGAIGPTLRGYGVALRNGQILFQMADGNGPGGFTNYFVGVGPVVANGAWHHIAITVTRGSFTGIRLYVDGQLVPITPSPKNHPGSLSNTAPLTIGRDTLNIIGHFNGILDELEIFNRQLQPLEVTKLNAAGAAGKCK